ncbi:MAG TPA: hypothetical protein QF630_10660, partial [Alphaproteobacteria bacterium]|nr:hypothetical protein [Alphaproteobacteria bacterium]
AIISHCKSQLASYRCPERIFFVEEMPLNAAGKVLRHELAKQMIGAILSNRRERRINLASGATRQL